MKIAICDDNRDDLFSISSILDAYIQERGLPIFYKAFHSSIDLLSTSKSGEYDLYLLDVMMPVLNGMDAAKEIRSVDKMAKIAFLTFSPEFAIESYSVKACNYILKPVTKEKLFFALDDVMATSNMENEAAIVVKSSEGIVKILLSQLTYVETLDRKVLYYLSSGTTVACASGFSVVCEELSNYSEFVQTHRCYMVNMRYIRKITNTEIILQSGASLPISRKRVAELKERYLAFQMEG